MPESVYNLLQSIRELLQRACSEGLMPFMLASTQGTPAKRNTVRIFEWASLLIAIIVPLIYFGGMYIERLEQVTRTQVMMQESQRDMQNKQHRIELKLTEMIGLVKYHMGENYHGEDE